MLTNNYYTLLKTLVVYDTVNYLGDALFSLVNVNGGLVKPYTGLVWRDDIMLALYLGVDAAVRQSYKCSSSVTAYGGGIVLGSGARATSENDYKLESIITSGFSSVLKTAVGKDEDGNLYREHTISLTATGNSGLTVSELGSIRGSDRSDGTFLFDRTVLDSPVVLKYGESATIKYRITNASVFNF